MILRMKLGDYIHMDSGIMLGRPVIRGTRITVELVLRKLAEGASENDLLHAYPQLTRNAVRAAVEYAAETIAHQETVAVIA